MRGLSLFVAKRGPLFIAVRAPRLSLSRPLLLRSTGSRRAGSVIVAHGPSCSKARGIFRDQGSNPCPLHWQADSQPLRHQGSPLLLLYVLVFWPQGMWDLSSLTRDRTCTPCIGRRSLNHWTAREVPAGGFLTTAPPGKSTRSFLTAE